MRLRGSVGPVRDNVTHFRVPKKFIDISLYYMHAVRHNDRFRVGLSHVSNLTFFQHIEATGFRR